jgi:hypothetical protein
MTRARGWCLAIQQPQLIEPVRGGQESWPRSVLEKNLATSCVSVAVIAATRDACSEARSWCSPAAAAKAAVRAATSHTSTVHTKSSHARVGVILIYNAPLSSATV